MWINQPEAFAERKSKLANVAYPDRRLPERVVHERLGYLQFADSAFFSGSEFWDVLRALSNEFRDDNKLSVVSLDPDAEKGFYSHYGEYAAIDLDLTDSAQSYHDKLSYNPSDSLCATLLDASMTLAWFGLSKDWVIWCERLLDLLIIATAKPFDASPFIGRRYTINDPADVLNLIALNFRNNTVPDDWAQTFLANYPVRDHSRA